MRSRKFVCALGFFDGVHMGHGKIIREAENMAKALKVSPAVVTFDVRPKSLVSNTGEKLISPLRLKEKLVSTLFPDVSLVTLPFTPEMAEMEPESFVEHMLKGGCGAVGASAGEDFRFGKNASGDVALLKKLLRTSVVPTVLHGGVKVSSSGVREHIEKGEFDLALDCLGHPFLLGGTVEHGDGRGHNIGFATLNLPFDPTQLYPGNGVYASLAQVGDGFYPAVTNIGRRPTFYSEGRLTNETHIIGSAPGLYGKEVWIWLCGFIRPEKRFGSAEELRARVDADISTALGILEERSVLADRIRRKSI